MRLSTLLLTALLMVPALAASGPAAAADKASFDQSWMQEGFTLRYAGAGALAAPSWQEPTGWTVYEARIDGFSTGAVHVVLTGSDPSWVFWTRPTYNLTTRAAVGGSVTASFWINDADVSAGGALIGSRWATLVDGPPGHHRFSDGSRAFDYDARTGLLSAVIDLGTGAFSVRAA